MPLNPENSSLHNTNVYEKALVLGNRFVRSGNEILKKMKYLHGINLRNKIRFDSNEMFNSLPKVVRILCLEKRQFVSLSGKKKIKTDVFL